MRKMEVQDGQRLPTWRMLDFIASKVLIHGRGYSIIRYRQSTIWGIRWGQVHLTLQAGQVELRIQSRTYVLDARTWSWTIKTRYFDWDEDEEWTSQSFVLNGAPARIISRLGYPR